MSFESAHQKQLTDEKEATGLETNANEFPNCLKNIDSGRIWHLYVLQCADGSLYCGIALDVQKRLTQHQGGKGARYTRARLPVTLLNSTAIGPDVADALKAERRFKALPRTKKLKSVKSDFTLLG